MSVAGVEEENTAKNILDICFKANKTELKSEFSLFGSEYKIHMH